MYLDLLALANYQTAPPLSGNELMKAITHLYKSLDLIEGARKRVETGILDALFTSDDLAKGWFQVNCCRVYTEKAVILEEYLQPAMGLINDAKCMIDSLAAWGLGMTFNGRRHIISCLEEAESAIRGVVEEMEGWVSVNKDDNLCPDCGRRYAYGDNYCSGCGKKLNPGMV
jgi:hypothetical protein